MIPLGTLASGRVASGDPNSPPISGYAAWWDFRDTASVDTSLGIIQAIYDKSGFGNDLYGIAGPGGPAYEGSADFGGYQIAVFSGDQGLESLGSLGAFSDFTSFVFAKKQTTSQTGGDADVLISIGGMSSYVNVSTLTVWAGTGPYNLTSNSAIWQPIHIHTRMLEGSNHSYWLDGTSYLLGGSGDPISTSEVLVGSETGNAGSDWEVGEILIYPWAMDPSERDDTELWINTKWFGA